MKTVDRIQFIKRSQALGFSLNEIATFLRLEHGIDRKTIRKVAADRLSEIQSKIADSRRMEGVLSCLIGEREATGRAKPCPVIAALSGDDAKGPSSCS
jgi:DNA-binding transcriptional MerR regulator